MKRQQAISLVLLVATVFILVLDSTRAVTAMELLPALDSVDSGEQTVPVGAYPPRPPARDDAPLAPLRPEMPPHVYA